MNYASARLPVIHATQDERAAFLTRTYLHLLGAIFAFLVLEVGLFVTGIAHAYSEVLLSSGRLGWLVVMGAFMLVSWVADGWARRGATPGMQYLGLGLYVVAEALIFAPLLFVAAYFSSPEVIPSAALTTAILFSGLTAVVFITRKDFSFMRGVLMLGGFAAIGLIVVSLLFGFDLGIFFSWAMVALASGYVLYTTGNILHHYRTDQHVSASLALFAAIALMFWYLLQIFMRRD